MTHKTCDVRSSSSSPLPCPACSCRGLLSHKRFFHPLSFLRNLARPIQTSFSCRKTNAWRNYTCRVMDDSPFLPHSVSKKQQQQQQQVPREIVAATSAATTSSLVGQKLPSGGWMTPAVKPREEIGWHSYPTPRDVDPNRKQKIVIIVSETGGSHYSSALVGHRKNEPMLFISILSQSIAALIQVSNSYRHISLYLTRGTFFHLTN